MTLAILFIIFAFWSLPGMRCDDRAGRLLSNPLGLFGHSSCVSDSDNSKSQVFVTMSWSAWQRVELFQATVLLQHWEFVAFLNILTVDERSNRRFPILLTQAFLHTMLNQLLVF